MGVNAGGSGSDYALFLGDDSTGNSRSGGGRGGSAGFESVSGKDFGPKSRSSSSGGLRKTQGSSSSISHSPVLLERKTTSHSGGYDGECSKLNYTVYNHVDMWIKFPYNHEGGINCFHFSVHNRDE